MVAVATRYDKDPGVSVLSQAETAAYRTDGVAVPDFRLPPDALAHLQSLAARLIADNPHMGDEPVASPHVPGSGVQNVRIGYALRYMPATSHYDRHDLPIPDSRGSAHHTRPLIQVRGRDVSGRNDFRIGHLRPVRLNPRTQSGPTPPI